MRAHTYALDTTWRLVLNDLGLNPADVLRRAGLPDGLLTQPSVRLESAAYYRLWRSMEVILDDPAFPLRLIQNMRTEAFSPPIFAALCSPDLLTALDRIRRYKPLVAPIRLEIEATEDSVALTLAWLDAALATPPSLVMAELAFFVELARTTTRAHVRPARVVTSAPIQARAAYERYFGAPLVEGDAHTLIFRRVDAVRPFLTANAAMWDVFEPALQQRLTELDASASVASRVRAALLEGLPSGRISADTIASRLAMSKRTLQRKLRAEATSFQDILRDTREALARHYLERTELAAAEIAFLLGFEEPTSFYRAFNAWTGQTPERVRQATRA